MDNSELLQWARNYATTQDLYDLLGVSFETPKEDIHRAWRRRSLAFHPDKAKDAFDPEKWQLFERARDILSSVEARKLYDSTREAKLQRERARSTMDAQRREMIEDLEARERGVSVKRARTQNNGMSEMERRKMAEAGRRRMEERRRMMAEAEERERDRERFKKRKEGQRQQSETHQTADHMSKMDIDTEPNSKERSQEHTIPSAVEEGGPDFDPQIADLERRLREARERKAAKQAKKAERKTAYSTGDSSAPPNDTAATTTTHTTYSPSPPPLTSSNFKIPSSSIPELKADAKKGYEAPPPPPPPSLSTKLSRSSKAFSFTPTVNSTLTASSFGKTKFSSTMERLRAAQAEKEARKRAEAETEAAMAS